MEEPIAKKVLMKGCREIQAELLDVLRDGTGPFTLSELAESVGLYEEHEHEFVRILLQSLVAQGLCHEVQCSLTSLWDVS